MMTLNKNWPPQMGLAIGPLAALLVLAGIGYYLLAKPTEYEERVTRAQPLSTAWARFQVLAGDMDPNAWAIVFPRDSPDREKWAQTTYEEVVNALQDHDPSAIEYVCQRYKTYRNLESLRQDYCSL